MLELRDNPLALADASAARIDHITVNGTTLYTEARGSGPPVLLIPGGAEDAEGWRPVAERLTGHTVITYDRRGTLRSARDDWPGEGAAQHADDAAGLLEALSLREVVVFGGSSAGVIAVELAMRHPTRLRRVLAYEPGYIAMAPGGADRQVGVLGMVDAHLEEHPGDWVGAYRMFVGEAELDPATGLDASEAAPAVWFARREDLNAEAFVRDDLSRVAGGDVDRSALATIRVDTRFSYGSRSARMFRDIATTLAAVRGATPDVIEGVDHAIYRHPGAVATYIHEHASSGAKGSDGVR